MFLCLAVLAISAGALAQIPQPSEKFLNVVAQCQEETKVSQESIEQAFRGEFVEDPKLKKQSLCVGVKLGLTNENGDVFVDVLKQKLLKYPVAEVEADQIIKKCIVKEGAPEEKTFQAIKCVALLKPNFFFVD